MPAAITTELIRDRGMSVIASDIPADMTLAQYRKRPRGARASGRKISSRVLRGDR